MITILFLTASPNSLIRLNLEQEANRLQEAILHRAWSHEFQVVQRWKTSASDLQTLLNDYQPDIVHFSSHGSQQHEIILENAQGKPAAVPAATLGKLFALHKANVRCVVLNACYSHVQAAAIAAHIPCVIGMSDVIADSMALEFAAAFYRALADGSDLNAAFGQGALQIELVGDEEQAQVPVLLPDIDAGKGLTLVSGQRFADAPPPAPDQAAYRRSLDEFLLPLQLHMNTTRRTFNRLRDDRELAFIERPIGSLQQYFASLPDSDPRQALWMIWIDLLVSENAKAAVLIESHPGWILRADFRQACFDYVDHVRTWEAVWTAMRAGLHVPASTALVAPRFPTEFDVALQQEIAEVSRRAGLR
jgi:hypothetical protein